jgi:hypothetical protein
MIQIDGIVIGLVQFEEAVVYGDVVLNLVHDTIAKGLQRIEKLGVFPFFIIERNHV